MRRLLSNESKNRRKLQLLSAIMIITGYLILYAVFQITSNSEKRNISQEADEVLEFLQSSCQKYDDYQLGNQVDNLQNLQLKAENLCRYLNDIVLSSNDQLVQFEEDQSLTGIWILDADLNTEYYADRDQMERSNLLEQILSEDNAANVQQYPQNEITDLAAHILKGVQEGRLLARDSHTFGSIWQRRSAELAEAGNLLGDSSSSTAILPPDSAFSTERNVPFLFILAYEEGKVNENMLLFEVARYNFSTFLVKNFDLAFAHERGIGMLQIRPFNNYDETQQYFRRLYANPEMAARLSGMRAILISEANYAQLIKQYSFDDYDAFYRTHFSSIPEPELKGYTLDEPLLNLPTEEEERQREENLPTEEDDPENGVIFGD